MTDTAAPAVSDRRERREGTDMISPSTAAKPVNAVGSFFAMALDTLVLMFRPPFAWREFLLHAWFVARVSILPTLMLSIPFTVLLVFTFNILLTEFGAADFSGTGAAFGTVTQIGPIVTALVVAGAGATAMCADLGARTLLVALAIPVAFFKTYLIGAEFVEVRCAPRPLRVVFGTWTVTLAIALTSIYLAR